MPSAAGRNSPVPSRRRRPWAGPNPKRRRSGSGSGSGRGSQSGGWDAWWLRFFRSRGFYWPLPSLLTGICAGSEIDSEAMWAPRARYLAFFRSPRPVKEPNSPHHILPRIGHHLWRVVWVQLVPNGKLNRNPPTQKITNRHAQR